MPPERVDEIIEYEIDDSEVARLQLTPTDQFETIQHIELPDSPVVVTEHRFRLYETIEGDIYYPYAPEVHGQPIFGPRLLASTQGTRSQAGQRYNERMWTAIATCKKQNQNFFDFLLESIKAKIEGNQAPTFFA